MIFRNLFSVLVCSLCALLAINSAAALDKAPEVKGAISSATATTHRPDEAFLASLPIIWTSKAEVSSAYSDDGWAAKQLIGPPNVYPKYGDIPEAWATRDADDGFAWATVHFPNPTKAQAILIYETLNIGAVMRVDDMSDPKNPIALWNGATRQGGTKSRVMMVSLPSQRTISAIRIVLDSNAVPGWNEIDAIGLLETTPDLGPDETAFNVKPLPDRIEGATLTIETPVIASLKGRAHWAQQLVTASGERGMPAFGAIQALATPDVYPDAGDIDRAWNPDVMDEGGASITVRFHPTPTRQVLIVTNANGRAIAQIDDLTDPKKPTTLWFGSRDTLTGGAQIVTLTLPTVRQIDTLRVTLDTTRTPGWEAIDAIGLAP